MLRRVENTVDGKTNVQILGRAAHLKLDQLPNFSTTKFRKLFTYGNPDSLPPTHW